MAKKNLPNIPLYIGDWEKDCNVLSLQTEAAWLRIIFKMFTNGKQSSYKIPTKGLQNLWRVSDEVVSEIITELIDYNICRVSIDGRFVTFTSRRYEKENAISEVRKEAVSKRSDRTNSLQKDYKNDTKHIQTSENEIENEKSLNKKEECYDKNLFLKDWNELRTEHKDSPSHANSLGGFESENNFNNLKKDYNREEIRKGMIGLFKQEKFPNGNTMMHSNPRHFLSRFESYHQAFYDKNTSLYGKKEVV